MTSYQDCSQDELLGIIEKLEAENRRLRQRGKSAGDAADNDAGELAPGRFKAKYAAKILDRLPDMLTVLSPEGVLVDLVSSEQTNHIGEPGNALIGRDICTMLSAEAYASVKDNLDRVNASGEGSTSHHDITLDGVTRHYENRIFKLDEQYALCMCRDVTEQQQAKNELEQAYRRMKMAEQIEALNHWYYYEQSDEVESPGLVGRLPGIGDPQAVRCRSEVMFSAIHPADRAKVLRLLTRGEFPGDYVEFRIRLDGEDRFLHSRVIYTGGEPGSRVIEGYTQDMTRIVERVRELEALKYAINNVEEEIYACTLDGSMEFANAQFRNRNRVEGEMTGFRVYELGAQRSTREEWEQRVASIRSNDGTLKYTVRFKDDTGRVVAMEVVCYLIYDRTKECEMVWFFGRDITRRVENETRVKELNSLMDTILNNIPVYLFVKDPGNEFRYLYWNKAFEEHSGIPASKVLGRTDLEVFPDPRDAEKFRRDDLELLRTNGRLDFTEEYKAATGETRIVTTSKALVPAENRLPLIIGIAWDITEQKKTERELIEARIRAEESDRMKSVFLATMSHEIRTPLNAIVGFSELIAAGDCGEEQEEYQEIIRSNSNLLLQLVNDILDLSRIESGKSENHFQPVEVTGLLDEVGKVHSLKMTAGVELKIVAPARPVWILTDRNRLTQVLFNFLSNAIKNTQHGCITLGAVQRDGWLDLFVSDTGCGMPENKIPLIFNRFEKLNDFVQGTGLGLSICQSIAERLGGYIDVQSQLGVGSTFSFCLPYRADAELEVAELQQPVAASVQKHPDRKRKVILVAEDVEANYRLLAALLKKEYTLRWVTNGREALHSFVRERPDLILMDIKMPEMNGIEATERIRSISPDIPIIAVTAHAYYTDKEQALAAGCNAIVSKPYAIADLKQAIERWINPVPESAVS